MFSGVHNATDNRFYIIPGGGTPKLFLNILSQKVEDWSRTHLILSDERIVDDRHLSNEAMVEEEFLKKIVNNEKPLLLKYNRNGSQTGIEKILKYQTPNLAILGLGSDVHTASLFPGNSEILYENDKICLRVKNSWENYDRISLSFSYLMKSNQIIFLVSGESKAKALEECLVGNYNPIQYPAQFIFRNYKNTIYILCDKLAGENIK